MLRIPLESKVHSLRGYWALWVVGPFFFGLPTAERGALYHYGVPIAESCSMVPIAESCPICLNLYGMSLMNARQRGLQVGGGLVYKES